MIDTTFYTEHVPCPPLRNRDEALVFLEHELPEWLHMLGARLEAGQEVRPMLLCELSVIAENAARVARTGEDPRVETCRNFVPLSLADLATLLRQELAFAANQDADPTGARMLAKVIERELRP